MKYVKTIYLADDDDDDRMLIREAIENLDDDIRIIEVVDGKDLLNLINDKGAEHNPSLIILDMNMPRMTGLESLSLLKLNPASGHIPIVMISTSSNAKLIQQAYDLGINAYITKPVLFQEYSEMAEAINVCFLNNHPSLKNKTYQKTSKTKDILVVEDSNDHWELMNLSISHSMPEVVVSRTIDKFNTMNLLTERLNNFQPMPDLILLDLYLPTQLAGLTILKAIRNFFASHDLSLVPIIMISSSGSEEDIRASYQHQASAYMVKSPDLVGSFAYFKDLCNFWLSTIVPEKRI